MITKVWAVINQTARLSRPVIFNCTGAPKCLPRRELSSASCKELAAAALQTVHRHQPWPGMAVGSHSCCVPTQLVQEPKALCCKPAWARLSVGTGRGAISVMCSWKGQGQQFSSFLSGRRHGTAQSAVVSFQHQAGTTEPICELCNRGETAALQRHTVAPPQLIPALPFLEAGRACTALFTVQVRQKLGESWAAWSYSLRSHNKPGTWIRSVKSWVQQRIKSYRFGQ